MIENTAEHCSIRYGLRNTKHQKLQTPENQQFGSMNTAYLQTGVGKKLISRRTRGPMERCDILLWARPFALPSSFSMASGF
jgi:hypothetical protein